MTILRQRSVLCLLAMLCVPAHRAGAQGDVEFGAAFEEIHRTAAEQFYDPDMRGRDWDALGREFRPRAERAANLEAFAAVINEMLALLQTSHTHFYTAREPRYWQLLAIFKPAFEAEFVAAHPDNPTLEYSGIGIFTETIDGEVFISGVLEGWPAHDAGLRVGNRIISVEGQPFQAIGSFEGRAGKPTRIEIQRTPDADSQTEISVIPVIIDPSQLFVRAMDKSIRLIERDGKRIGYVHLWSYAGDPYHAMLKSEIAFGRLKDADAMILDIRGGWGGANPEDLNLFNRNVPTMTQILRDGTRRAADFQWRKPVALLVDGGSRSGKEIYAYGFKKHGIGPVVGSRTAGAVVGGRPFLIRPGMLLYLAVLDVRVDDTVRLEGVGVEPDIDVPFDLRYANGADLQLEAAIRALH